jgi:hypothetical protein
MVRALVILVALSAAGTGLAAEGVAGPSSTRLGVSFEVPQAWHLATGRINGVLDPVTVFTVSTFRLSTTPPSSGICAPALRRAWRTDGAYVQLAEERDGASRKRMLRRVLRRPKHFRLDAKGAGGLCTPPNSGELTFQDGGRVFYVYYGFGGNASQATHAAAASLLGELRITPRR